MADTKTTHLELIKQDPNSIPDILDEHSNLDTLDDEIWKRGKAFNGTAVGNDGGFHIRTIPYAENLETSASQSSDENFIIRMSGGDASLEDGDAWLTLVKGTYVHNNYTPQSVDMTVIPMARPVPAAITATLDAETFEAYVEEAGTYTITYSDSWSTSPTLYGITVSGTPVYGDSITVVWDGESSPEMTVNAVERQAEPAITATIDEDTFVAYVSQSGTTTLTYSTAWSADPTLYGVTVTGTPVAGDVITIVYVKEVRGTIVQSTPESFISTGWNLYKHTSEYSGYSGIARVIKYSNTYNFKIAGTYTGLEFATTLTGSKVTITPVSGSFSIPSDGYLFVTGGNNTDTAIWMTWSDWVSGYRWNSTTSQQGDWEAYTESEIDLADVIGEDTPFPYGLLAVGTVQDEINLNIGIATSRVERLAYTAQNLADAKASGRIYEYDENYIYLERATAVVTTVDVDGGYIANDHGMEMFTGTEQAVYAQTLYGANLKNKLERDVVTISQQTLNDSQQEQVQKNIGVYDLTHYKTIGSFTTESALATALDTELASMPNYSKISIRFNFTTAVGAFRVLYYYGTLTRAGSSASGKIQVNSSSSTANARMVIGSKSTTWIFRQIANSSDVDDVSGKVSSKHNRKYVSTVAEFNSYCNNDINTGESSTISATADVMNAIVSRNSFGIMTITKVSNTSVYIEFANPNHETLGTCVYNFSTSTTTNLNDLNDKITSHALGNETSFAAFESDLITFLSSMNDSSARSFSFHLPSGSAPLGEGYYVGIGQRVMSNRYIVIVNRNATTQFYRGMYAGESWTWKLVAYTDDLDYATNFSAGDYMTIPNFAHGYALNASNIRFMVNVSKIIPSSGVTFEKDFTVATIFSATGASVDTTNAVFSFVRSSPTNVYVQVSSLSGLTSGATYSIQFGGNRRIKLVAST